VGGVLGRSEYLPVGDPLTQAFESEGQSKGGGHVVCSENMFELIKDYFYEDFKIAKEWGIGAGFHAIEKVRTQI
jgi:hypothetical protein